MVSIKLQVIKTSTIMSILTFSLISIICLGCVQQSVGDKNPFLKKAIRNGKAFLTSIKEKGNIANKYIESPKPGELFQEVAKDFEESVSVSLSLSAALGLSVMSSSVEKSKELKDIIVEIENVRKVSHSSSFNRLDLIKNLNSTTKAFIASFKERDLVINILNDAKNTTRKDEMKYFSKQYKDLYKMATSILYKSLTGEFNLINLYKEHLKCNPIYLAELCTAGIHLIVQGLNVEATIIGVNNLIDQTDKVAREWKGNLKKLRNTCSEVITQCENDWERYASEQFKTKYEEVGGSNQNFSKILATSLSDVVPQRFWLTVVYKETMGFSKHTFYSEYDHEKIWRYKGHCATIFSIPKYPQVKKETYNLISKLISDQKNIISGMTVCTEKVYWLINSFLYRDIESKTITEKLMEKYKKGVIYVIASTLLPGHHATGGMLFSTDLTWNCDKKNYKLIIFQ